MRVVVTVLAILLGLAVVVGAYYNALDSGAPQPAVTPPPPTSPGEPQPTDEKAPGEPPLSQTPAPEPAQTAVEAPQTPPAPVEGLRVLPAEGIYQRVLGATDPQGPFRVEVKLNPYGAAVERIALADHRMTVGSDDPYVIHSPLVGVNAAGNVVESHYPFAARSISINGVRIDLEGVPWTASEVTQEADRQSVEFRAVVGDASGTPVVELVRRYILPQESFDLRLEQEILNRSGQPLQVAWDQNIQGDLTLDDAAYMGDRRMLVTGYFRPDSDPGRSRVRTTDGFVHRTDVLDDGFVWPPPWLDPNARLAWLATENRYFAVVTHRVVAPDTQRAADVPELQELFPRVEARVFPARGPGIEPRDQAIVFTVGTAVQTLDPGATLALPLAVYAGPRLIDVLSAPPYKAMGLDQLVRFDVGCWLCLFQPIAWGLLYFLKGIDFIVRDWGLAIIILVIVVRLILHPLTKKAQVNMMRLGKQMQALQPEVEKIRKKYGEDQAKVNAEMMKLYREKGVNPANMLGCLPMFLQTPIWAALYAMLYSAIELRHEPAFYGVFQKISGGSWQFLSDLSSPDHFIQFGTGFTIPLPFITNTLNAINILPILMGVVFYLNMKFTSPPQPEGKLTEQQEMMRRQQRMMQIIFPIMMPFFLYSAPSGLTLYITASTLAGIVDSYIVRKHVKAEEASGKLFEKKPVKPGGFRDRMNKMLEQKQREFLEKQQDMQRKRR